MSNDNNGQKNYIVILVNLGIINKLNIKQERSDQIVSLGSVVDISCSLQVESQNEGFSKRTSFCGKWNI